MKSIKSIKSIKFVKSKKKNWTLKTLWTLRPYGLKRGFTLLFASLIVSLLLAVGLAILEITLQQFLLSSAGRESQFAFYNADTGIECAIYWDKKGPDGRTFLLPADALEDPTSLNQSDIRCDGKQAFSYLTERSDILAISSFNVILDTSQCPSNPGESINIVVTKSLDEDDPQIVHTKIQSRGYNTCDLTNARRVERGLQVDY